MNKLALFAIPVAVGLTVVARAQDDVKTHSFACSSTEAESTFEAELNHPSKQNLLSVTDKEGINRAQASAHHVIYGEIDSAKYRINKIEFYIRQNRPKDNLPYAPLDIYVKVTASQKVLWWKVVSARENTPDFTASFLTAEVPNDEESPTQSPVSVLPATGDRTIPIFDLQWTRQETGVWVNSNETHLMLDLRSAQPYAVADLACNSLTAFGACGVYDAQAQENNKYECDWTAADNDFRCQATTWNRILGRREVKSWFQLLSGKEIAFATPPGSPATLQQFAEVAERDPSWRTRQVELPGLGKTSDVLRLSAAGSRTIHIFGSYGGKAPFSTQFFFVILSKDAPVLGYIPALSFFGSDGEDKVRRRELEFERGVAERQALPVPPSQIETGTNLTFQVKVLFTAPPTRIYQVSATEDDGRSVNRSHAVYWLAIDEKPPGQTIFGLAKLASDVPGYTGCGRYASEDSAAAISVVKGMTFTAVIDVEPPHNTSENGDGFLPPDPENGDKPEDQCPYSVHLGWNHKEWVAGGRKTKCATQFTPRIVGIAADGSITSKPGEVLQPDSP